MTLYAVLGDGEMPEKEVAKQLDDLWKKAEQEDQDFWFLMEAKPSINDTEKSIIDFFNKGGMHYVLLTPDGVTPDDAYVGVGEYVDVSDISGDTIVEALNLLRASEEENNGVAEEAVVLALFSDISGDSTADDVLIAQLTATIKAGFKAYALNDAMEEIELREEAPVELPEDAVKPKVEEPVVEDVPAPDSPDAEPLPLDKVYLSGLTAAELKELCKGMGIPYTTKAEAVAAILAQQSSEASVVPEPVDTPVSDGADMDDAESDFVEVDGEVYPTEDIILEAPAAEATAYQATVSAGEEQVTAVHPIGTGVPNLEDPLVKEDIRTSGVTKNKVHAYEVQYSFLPKSPHGQRTYRSNHKLLVISTNIIRATAIIMMKHQDEDCQVHQIVQRSHDKVMIDSAIFGEE